MENNNFRTVRVYTKKYNSKDKDGNTVIKESKQKQVSLKKEDPFEDNDLVVVLSTEEYDKISNYKAEMNNIHEKEKEYSSKINDYEKKIDNLTEQINNKDNEIANLKEELESIKSSSINNLDDLKDELLNGKEEIIKSKDKIHDLQDKLTDIEEERVLIYKELDYKNKMILAYNVELNKSILKAINVVIDEAKENINRRNLELSIQLDKSIQQAKLEVNEKNRAIAFEIDSTVDAVNEEIRNTSMLKMLLNKNKINVQVPTSTLLKPFEFDLNTDQLLSGQALELDASEIIKEVLPKLPEPFSKFIETKEEVTKTIDIKEKRKKDE